MRATCVSSGTTRALRGTPRQAVELTHSYCRSDYYDFVAEMRREG